MNGLTRRGKKIWGYGASTKGNTLLQYYGLSTEQVIASADWHFTDEFLEREADLRRAGTRFIVPLPELRGVYLLLDPGGRNCATRGRRRSIGAGWQLPR